MASIGPDIVPPMTPPIDGGIPNLDGVSVLLDGGSFKGWKTVSISKNLEAICNDFTIELDDKFDFLSTWPLKPDTEVKIGIGAERVFTGRIEVAEPEFNPESRSFVISGRSLAGDIVDCTHEGPTEYRFISIDKLAEEMCRPFGIKIFLSVNVIPTIISKFSVKPGETVFEAIDRAARIEGFMWIATRGGNIRLTRAGKFRGFSSLQQDVNILSASATYDSSQRFKQYTVKGQAAGVETFFGPSVAQPVGIAFDAAVKRYRPTTIIAEGNVDLKTANARAEWEVSNRLAKSARVNVEVEGWRQFNGQLWGLNQVIFVRSKFLGIQRDMLTVQVRHTKSNGGGTRTHMTLVDPQAYSPQPVANLLPTDDILGNLGPGLLGSVGL